MITVKRQAFMTKGFCYHYLHEMLEKESVTIYHSLQYNITYLPLVPIK